MTPAQVVLLYPGQPVPVANVPCLGITLFRDAILDGLLRLLGRIVG